jgi:hypothetical protein
MVISKNSSITASRGHGIKSLEKSEHSDPVYNKHIMQKHFERRRFSDSREAIGTISHTPLKGNVISRALLSEGITSNTVSNLHLREDGVGTKQWVGRMLANDFSKTTSCLPDINDRVKYCSLTKGNGSLQYIWQS